MSLITVGVARSFALSIPVGINIQPLIGNGEIATPYFNKSTSKKKEKWKNAKIYIVKNTINYKMKMNTF